MNSVDSQLIASIANVSHFFTAPLKRAPCLLRRIIVLDNGQSNFSKFVRITATNFKLRVYAEFDRKQKHLSLCEAGFRLK